MEINNTFWSDNLLFNMDNTTDIRNITLLVDRDIRSLTDIADIALYVFPIISVVILATNGMVVSAIVRFKCLQTPPYIFVFNTSVADILTSITTSPLLILYLNKQIDDRICMILTLILFPFMVSILSVFLICIDRFICIATPYFYRRWMTMKTSILLSLGLWVFAIGICFSVVFVPIESSWVNCFSIIFNSEYTLLLMALFGMILITMTILYGIICRIAWIQRNMIMAINAVINGNEFSEKDRKIQNMLITVLGIFYVCWMPRLSIMLWEAVAGHKDYRVLKRSFEVLCLCNSFINPFVYAFKSRQFRAAFKLLLRMKVSDAERDSLAIWSWP